MESTIVMSSQLNNTKSFRIDAEYYHPKAIEYELTIVQKFHGQSLKTNGCKVVSGPFGSSLKSEAYLESGVPFIRISDLQDFLISDEKLIYISEEDNDRLSCSKLNVGDIVLSKVGNTIGVASIVTSNIGYCNISENNIGIRMPSSMDDKDKSFLVTYLNSIPGQNQILRAISGNAQPKLNVADIEEVKVPHTSDELMMLIHSNFESSTSLIKQSESTFKEAENILLSELGLTNWEPKHQLAFIKNLSDTQQVERIDAEYYQPKYDEIISAIKNYSGGWDTLDNLVTLKNKNFKPKDREQYQYIELANIEGNGEITDSMFKEGKDLPTRARRKVARDDVIVSSIEGSLSSIALIEKEYNLALCSTGFHVVNSKQFNSETLLVLLKSIVGQMQLKKGCSGTILTAINKEEFKSIILPKVAEVKQQEILQKVTESFNLRKKSKHFLEYAKEAVEMAIEQNEKTAIKWLQNKLKKIQVS